MDEKVEHTAMLDGPFDSLADGAQEPLQMPAAAAEGADVADGAHRDLNEPAVVDERLSRGLGRDDALVHLRPRLLARRAHAMRRIQAADPGVAKVAEHLLDIGALAQAVTEAARSAEAGRRDVEPAAHGRRAKPDVVADHVRRLAAFDQPGTAAKAKLHVL